MNKKGLVGVVKFSLVAVTLVILSLFIINFVLPTFAAEPKDVWFQVTDSSGVPVANAHANIWTSDSIDGTYTLESSALTDVNGLVSISTFTGKYAYFVFEKKGYSISWPKESTTNSVSSPEFFVINTNDITSSENEPIIVNNLDVIPQIWSDKSNYKPEETAIIYGTGFDYDSVKLKITWPNSTVVYINNVAVNQDGTFSQPYKLDGINGEFKADAVVSENVLASTTFDDNNETTVTLTPLADSWVNSNYPTVNYGSNTLLQVTNSSSTFIRQSYLKFDLGTIPSGKIITAATLHMYVTNDGEPSSRTLGTYFVSNDSWTEYGITWNNKPAINGLINSTSVGSGVWVVWDVSGNVQTEYSGDKIISMALTFPQQDSANYKYFYSKEYSSSGQRPYLEVKYIDITNPKHAECSNGQCIQVNETGSDQCSIDSDCYHSECDYVGRTCKQVNAWPDIQDQCGSFNDCIHSACVGQTCTIIDSPGTSTCTSNSQCLTPKHAECSNGQCIQVDGAGDNKCSIDSDCYHSECDYGLQQCVKTNAWPDVTDKCTSNDQCTACIPDIAVSKKVSPSSFSICQNTTVTLNVTGTGCPQTVHFPVDAMIVFDRTGSMDDDCPGGVEANATPCKIHDAKVASKFFVSLLNPSLDRSGLVSFNNTAILNQGLTYNGALVQNAIDTLKALGQTAIGGGISAANSELTSNGRPNAVWIEILLTDGNENLGSDPLGRANEAKADGIIIYTIGLGTSVDPVLLQQIASITGGKYFFAPDGTALQQIYQNISQEVLSIGGKNVVVKDVIPSYANYAGALSSNPADNCTYSAGTKTVTCTLGTLVIGQSYLITFNEQLNQAGNVLTNVYPDSNVTFTDFNSTQQTRIFPQTYANVTACDDGIFCNGVETCSAGSCIQQAPLNCSSLNGQCKFGLCNEASKNCTVSFNSTSTTCNDGLWCSATDHCDGQGSCVQLTARDCSEFNLLKVETCDNNPDSYHFTWDFRNSFTSICNETSDSCTSGNNATTHTCSVANCSAECDATHSCDNKCIGNVRYSAGNCSLTSCNCSYSTQNCDLQDNCYAYGNGCEDRDYFCQAAGCNYTFSNRNTDSYDNYVNYCSADAIRTHRTFHDFSCDGTCKDHTSLVNDSLVQDCNLQDGWYNTTTTQWISTGQCTEKEQLYQDKRDYTCSDASCTFSVVDHRWIDTGQTRNKPDTTSCDDNNFCTINDHCDGQGNCIGGGSKDCSGNNLVGVSTCDWTPDALGSTFDWRNAFTSECINTGNNTGHCTSGNDTITHVCADSNSTDGGPQVPVGDGIRTCSAQCDGFGTECQPYIGNDDFCYINGVCNSNPNACTCSWTKDNYCPQAGTVIDGYCYWGNRVCTANGCGLNKTLMGCNDYCDPQAGPKDTIGPTTTQLNIQRKCNIINVTANVSNCNKVSQAEYFFDVCPDASVRGQPMSALDGSFNSSSEIVYVNNIDLANATQILLDGRHNIYVRGKDEFGNWGNCSSVGFDLDIYPPQYPSEQHVESQVACGGNSSITAGGNVTITAYICEPPFIYQSFICNAEYFIDNFNKSNGEGYQMQPMDGSWRDGFCEWVTATLNTSQLSEGTHFIKVHAMDCACNWGKLDFETPIWFIKDTTPPVTTKTLIPYNSQQVQCYGNEAQDSNVFNKAPNGLTNGCSYVKSGTQIVLSAQDQDTPNHEFSNHVKINWIVWYKVNPGDSWTIDQQGVGEDGQNVTITLNKDSYHLIEYWSQDSCVNGEQPHHFELDIVDTKSPITTKTVGEPKLPGSGFDWWITKQTPITLNCSDQQPHPVSNVTLYARYKVDDGSWINLQTNNGYAQFTFPEDSIHTLEYHCVDALGNTEETHTETDKVDSTPPNTTKTYGLPKYPNSEHPQWINSSTPITLTAIDGGDICHVGVNKTYWRNTVLTSNSACENPSVCQEAQGSGSWNVYVSPFTKPEESCHLIEYYSVDLLGNAEPIKKQCVYVENTPPVSQKTVGTPNKSVSCNSLEQGTFTDNCYYVNQSTPITLSCSEVGPHPTGVANIYYKIDWKNQSSDSWTLGQWIQDSNQITFNYPEDSYHRLSWYCVDVLGNMEQTHTELDIVDTKKPTITKTIVGPYHGDCLPEDKEDECFIDGVTKIHVVSADSQPHPADDVTCDWDYTVTGGTKIGSGHTGVTPPFDINFPEESTHELTITCRDALGNSVTDIETFQVDKTPPITTKTYIGSQYLAITSETHGSTTVISGTPGQTICNTTVIPGTPGTICNTTVTVIPGTPGQTICNTTVIPGTPVGLAVNLGSAGNFAILSKSGISTTGTTLIAGDIGVSPIAHIGITGFSEIMDSSNQFSTSIYVIGKLYAADYAPSTPTKMTTAVSDMETAYTDAAGRSPFITGIGAGNIGGMTLTPGIYKWSSGVTIPTDVTLNCGGNSNAVFIFQIAQNLVISSGKQVILSGNCQAGNIFWQVAGQATLGTTSVFNGIILSKTAIILNTGATLNGRALAQTAVTLDSNRVSPSTATSGSIISNTTCYIIGNTSGSIISNTTCYTIGNTSFNTTCYTIGNTSDGSTIINTTVNETPRWITSGTNVILSVYDAGPHKSGIKETKYRVTLMDGNEPCANTELCQQMTGRGDYQTYSSPFTIAEQSCHLIEYYSVDNVNKTEITKKQCVYVENTPPVSQKTVGTPNKNVSCNSLEQGTFTDNCYYVNQSTPITLSCSEVGPHPTGVANIYYKIDWKNNTGDSWTEGTWVQGSNIVSFDYNEESFHKLTWYCVDALGNKEQDHTELDIVENTPPVSQKTVGTPNKNVSCNSLEQGTFTDNCYYVNQSTPITLSCSEVGPHPTGVANIYYKIDWKNQSSDSWTLGQWIQDSNQITFNYPEDSYHKLTWYCVDALGNKEQNHTELDLVDTRYPNVTKIVGEPKVSCGENCWFITNNTEISLDCVDQGPHPVDNVAIYYRYNIDGSEFTSWTQYSEPFKLPEYSNHSVQYYCKDILGNAGPIFTEMDKVDNKPPVIIPDPCHDERSGKEITIYANITDDKVGIDDSTTKAYIKCPNRTVDQLSLVYNSSTGRYEAQWTTPNLEGVCYVDFAASDLLGNAAYLTDGKFIVIDNTPPTIYSVFTGRSWIGLGDKFYVDAEMNDNSLQFERICELPKCLVKVIDNAGKTGYLQGQLESVQGILKCAGFVTVNDTFYEAQARLVVEAWDGADNYANASTVLGIDNARMISITGVNESKWFKGGQWINNVIATVDSSKFGELKSCSASISGVSPENTIQPIDNTCSGNIRIPTDISDGVKNLTIFATNINGKVVSDTVNVRIDNNAPEKIIISPVNGTYYGTQIPIILNVTDELSGVYNASFRIVKDPWVLFGLVVVPGTGYDSGWILTTFNGTTWNYTFNASSLESGVTYYFLPMVCDNVENCQDPVSYTIKIDNLPPQWQIGEHLIVTSSPYDKDGDVTLNWLAASDSNGVDHYNINVNGIPTTATAGTTYTFTGLVDGFYNFSVIPVDTIGNKGSELTGSTTVNRNCTVDVTCTSSVSNSGSSSSNSGSTGSGGSFSGTTYTGTPSTSSTPENQTTQPQETTESGCIPTWMCSSWSACENGKQTRECVDKNNCVETPRAETQDCSAEIAAANSISPVTGLFAAISSPIGYASIASLFIALVIAMILSRKRLPKRKHR